MSDRYHRQILAFGNEGQARLVQSEVAIVGLGGLGSHVAQSLAYLGVKSFVLIDDDTVDITNLNRLVGATLADAESGALKVRVAERLIRQITPDASIRAIAANLRTSAALQTLMSCPSIFGCVDNDGARLVLMELAAAYEATLIDAATEIFRDESSGILTEFGGRVVVARPGDFCLDCANQLDREVAKQELESLHVRALRMQHGYGLGSQVTAPAIISVNGTVANLAVTEFLAMTTGIRAPHRQLTYYALRGVVTVRTDGRRPDCYICGYLTGQRERANIHRYVVPDERLILGAAP